MDYDSFILVDDITFLKHINTEIFSSETARKRFYLMIEEAEGRTYRSKYLLDKERVDKRIGAETYGRFPIKYLYILLAIPGFEIRKCLPQKTEDFFFNHRLSRDVTNGCPEDMRELLIPKKQNDNDAEPAEVLWLMERIPEHILKEYIELCKGLTSHYFGERWYSKSRFEPHSVADRLFLMLYARGRKRQKDGSFGTSNVSNNRDYAGTVRDLYRDKISNNPGSAYMRFADVVITSYRIGASLHWVLGLDSSQPLVSENGYVDELFGYYTVLSFERRRILFELVKATAEASESKGGQDR